MSAAIKPEIYISWIPTGQIGLKPQIYATIIQAPIHEKISADLSRNVSKLESASGDLQRKIGNGETVSADVSRHVISTDTAIADTERKLFTAEKFSGDTLIKIIQSAEIHADTSRNVQSTEKVIGDTSRKIGVTTISADLQRRVNVTARAAGDICRRVEVEEKISGDLDLKITCAETVHADTFRKVEDSTPTVARSDTNRKIGVREKVSASTRRLIAQKESATADTLLQIAANEKVIADTMRGLREVVRADTLRKVTRAERAIAKTVIRVPHVLNYIVQSKPRTMKASPKLLGDNPLSLINTFKDYGVTAINITLNEKTLSDTFQFDIAARQMNINEAVQGYLLDYPFSFLVEETNQTELVQSVKGRYSIDDNLYTWFSIPTERITIDGEEYEVPGGRIEKGRNGKYVFIYPTASEIMHRVASTFGKLSVVSQIHDFTPSNLSGDDTLTYFDLLNSVFGWTSRLPHMQVNTFVRGDTLYSVQRGSESNIFDITDLPHSRPTINKKFNRVLCNNPNNNSNNNDDDDDDDRDLFSGVIAYSGLHFDLRYEYDNGFLKKELQHMDTGDSSGVAGISHPISTDTEWTTSNTTNSAEYTYISYEKFFSSKTKRPRPKNAVQKEELYEKYIKTKHAKNTTTQATGLATGTGYQITEATKIKKETVTQYHYAETRKTTSGDPEIYLVNEYETTYIIEYEYNPKSEHIDPWEKVSDEFHVKTTFHVPVGNGWYGQVVFLDGAFQGANLSQGKPGNRISPYTVKKFGEKIITHVTNADSQNENPLGELSAIVDSSFPVRDRDLKATLQYALRWLHRRTEETVTVDLISKIVDGMPEINHIVDFTDRVKLDGAEYFLVSNNISFTPRKLIQKLTLIRWY